MNELALENITSTECVECGDKLTSWENTWCIICEPDYYEIQAYRPTRPKGSPPVDKLCIKQM